VGRLARKLAVSEPLGRFSRPCTGQRVFGDPCGSIGSLSAADPLGCSANAILKKASRIGPCEGAPSSSSVCAGQTYLTADFTNAFPHGGDAHSLKHRSCFIFFFLLPLGFSRTADPPTAQHRSSDRDHGYRHRVLGGSAGRGRRC
jgi:hypothetical protein